MSVSYFAVDLEAGQVGNDRDLGSLGYLRSDLPVNEGQGRFLRRQYPGVFQQTCFLFERFVQDAQFQFLHAEFGSGRSCVRFRSFCSSSCSSRLRLFVVEFGAADLVRRAGADAVEVPFVL